MIRINFVREKTFMGNSRIRQPLRIWVPLLLGEVNGEWPPFWGRKFLLLSDDLLMAGLTRAAMHQSLLPAWKLDRLMNIGY